MLDDGNASSPVGTYPSSCSGAVDPNYTITYVPGAVVVGSAALVITASSGSMTYGGSVPAITPSYSGFVNGDTAASLTTQPTCSTTATAASPVGSYPSSCTGAVDPNYTISYVDGTVTVGPAPLTITASSRILRPTAARRPAVTASYSGFVNSDTASSLTTQPTCSTTATPSTPVGTYLSSCSGAVDANYTITYVGGSVQVTPATLSITASSALDTYGDRCRRSLRPTSASWPVTRRPRSPPSRRARPRPRRPARWAATRHSCSGAVDPNYTFSYIDGSLQVGPAPLAVTASSASITYGGAAPVIQASYSGFVNGDDATSLTTAPTCTTAVTSVSPVGTYDSSCSGAVDPNYTFSYMDGSVQVGPASITVTASSGSMVYAGSVPTVTASVDGLQNGEDASVLGAGLACIDHGHLGQPGGQLPDLVLGCGRLQLQHHVRERVDRGGPGAVVHLGLVGIHDLRRLGAHDQPLVLGLRERGHAGLADEPPDVLHDGLVFGSGGNLRQLVLGRLGRQLHRSATRTARCRS